MEVQLIIKNLNIYNSYFKKFIQGDVIINDGKFLHIGKNYEDKLTSKNIIDGNNKYIIPGLIDIHMHIESSMTIPSEFSKTVIKHGVTTVVADPHEIANVFGIDGINEFIKSKEKLDIFYGIPSSVPSTSSYLETTGGEITVDEVRELLSYENILCLGEVMNFKDLIEDENSEINNIIKVSKGKKIPLEGHCPKIEGVDLSFYIYRGVDGDHTQQSVASLEEKISNGMFIEIQHKSMTAENIKFLVENNLYEHFALATDDVMADKLTKGHLNDLVKEAVKLGMSIENAIYVSTYTPARRMRLFDRGSIAPGKIADFVLIDDIDNFNIYEVYKNGQVVFNKYDGLKQEYFKEKSSFNKRFYNSITLNKITEEDLLVKVPKKYNDEVTCRTINVMKNTTFTEEGEVSLNVTNNVLKWENTNCALIAVFERYGKNNNVAFGLVEGEIIKEGAVATTWAHDHHNVMVMGRNLEDMVLAVNNLIDSKGGYIVVKDNDILAKLELPIGGIVSDEPIEVVGEKLGEVRSAMKELGYNHMNEIMSFSTLSLPVSPAIKITDKGLIDVKNCKVVSLFK
ncbi:adenine deaminase C-terminal domain-containing protein [Clostridium sp. 1001271B_151109_B4]|uniref:adenine deaminase C-terminal domain-containing protein n=1 Tax=Clostridium sp. 1001271B_151109_B4 TaxID=2787148 RepID=UPI0018AC12AC|nr:adenine deaminase C-terminal domain-containing protein [Clostridium sp. 1001271B_151109_B4]